MQSATDLVMMRCLDSVSRRVGEGSDHGSIALMKAEIREVAREVARRRLSGEAKARLFLRPMEIELVERYGSDMGRSLYWDFIEAFWLQSWCESTVLTPARGVASGFSPEYQARSRGRTGQFEDELATRKSCPEAHSTLT